MMKYKKFVIVSAFCLFAFTMLQAQPPAGKYNTTNYPADRKAIEALNFMDSSSYFHDDYIAVGPEGAISYGFANWKAGFDKSKSAFKSVVPVPGMGVLRIYNGITAVRHSVLDVVFDTPGGELSIRVIRNETFIKQNGKWYFIAGQGTKALTEEETKEMVEKAKKH